MSIVYLNGAYLSRDAAALSVDDRGFTFGDGIYEVVRVIGGALFEWPAHAARMAHGLATLRIPVSAAEAFALEAVAHRLLDDNRLRDGEATIYLAITRGAAPRVHHFPPAGTTPTVFASASRFTRRRELRERGISAITSDDLRWARCDVKSLNLLGSVLARQAAAEAGAYEAIFVRDGIVTEGAATTVFAVIDGVLRTHPLGHRILPSITREVVMRLCRELGITVEERAITIEELRRAGEIFACGTATDIAPVVTLDGAPVAGGGRGPLSLRLADALEAVLDRAAAVPR